MQRLCQPGFAATRRPAGSIRLVSDSVLFLQSFRCLRDGGQFLLRDDGRRDGVVGERRKTAIRVEQHAIRPKGVDRPFRTATKTSSAVSTLADF